MYSREVPGRIYELLRGGFIDREAHWLLVMLRRDPNYYAPGTALHPGDPFGTVIAWLWQTTPDEAVMALAEYIAQLHKWDDLAADQDPAVRLDDILDGLRFALPNSFPSDQLEALTKRARRDVPIAYGANPNP